MAGINCIRPIAPDAERAPVANADSDPITARINAGSTACRRAYLVMAASMGSSDAAGIAVTDRIGVAARTAATTRTSGDIWIVTAAASVGSSGTASRRYWLSR